MKYKLTIRPAVAPMIRHAIEHFLEKFGFIVIGGGTDADLSECDISFEDKPEKKQLDKGNHANNTRTI